jgi:hypothetical protein
MGSPACDTSIPSVTKLTHQLPNLPISYQIHRSVPKFLHAPHCLSPISPHSKLDVMVFPPFHTVCVSHGGLVVSLGFDFVQWRSPSMTQSAPVVPWFEISPCEGSFSTGWTANSRAAKVSSSLYYCSRCCSYVHTTYDHTL